MSRTVPPVLPGWLIDAAQRLDPKARGVAIGFAAAGYVAGHETGYGTGFDAAMAAVRELDAAQAEQDGATSA